MWILRLALGATADGEPPPLSLAGALELAEAGNLELQRARLALDAAQAELGSARAGFDPTVAAGVDVAGPAGSTAWSAGATQPLPTGGTLSADWTRTRPWAAGSVAAETEDVGLTLVQPLLQGLWFGRGYALAQAHVDHAYAELDWQVARDELVLAVSGAYWGLVAARKSAELARTAEQVAAEQLVQTRERFDRGFVGSGEVLQVERSAGAARQARLRAELDEQDAAATFGRLVGRRDPVRLTDEPVAGGGVPSLEEARARAQNGNRTWARAVLDRATAELAWRQAVQQALPTLDAYGSVGFDLVDPARPQGSWSTGATLSLPVTLRGPLAELAAARARHAASRVALDAAVWDLDLAVESALRGVVSAEETERVARDTVRAATSALEADRELYREGRVSARDVVRSLEEQQDAQVSLLNAQIGLQRAELELRRVLGEL